jgi:hypothetical protein
MTTHYEHINEQAEGWQCRYERWTARCLEGAANLRNDLVPATRKPLLACGRPALPKESPPMPHAVEDRQYGGKDEN